MFGQETIVYYICNVKQEVLEMMSKIELNARIEEEKKNLMFYVRYREDIIEMHSEQEWVAEVDDCLDILIELYRLLKE
jgi:hypothetical protein